MVDAKITYVGPSNRGRHIENAVVPAIDEGLVPQHPDYGDADRESKRRVAKAKQRTRTKSKHPLKRRNSK